MVQWIYDWWCDEMFWCWGRCGGRMRCIEFEMNEITWHHRTAEWFDFGVTKALVCDDCVIAVTAIDHRQPWNLIKHKKVFHSSPRLRSTRNFMIIGRWYTSLIISFIYRILFLIFFLLFPSQCSFFYSTGIFIFPFEFNLSLTFSASFFSRQRNWVNEVK